MLLTGKVLLVREATRGSELAADAAAGDVSLDLEDVEAMDLQGGQLALGFEIKTYTVDEAPDPASDEIDLDDPPDAERGTVTLTTPLANPYPADTKVPLWPHVVRREALVEVEDRPEPITARIEDDSLRDRLETGTRDESTSETVFLAQVDDAWYVIAMAGEPGAGRSRGNIAAAGPFTITEVLPAVHELVRLPIEMPSVDHRLIVWFFAELDADVATAVHLGIDDLGIDFPIGEFEVAAVNQSDPAYAGPAQALPLLPSSPMGAWVNPTEAAIELTAFQPFLPTNLMLYTLDPPNVGLHYFRLTAWKDGPGNGTVSNAHLWATVI